MALTPEDLQAIRSVVVEVVDQKLEPMQQQLNRLEVDVKSIKRDTSITRVTVNAIGEWVDIAEHALKIDYPIKK